MTSVADLYLNDYKNELQQPPDMLLDVFTDWVADNPTLCLANQPPLALPPGAISMPVVTPLAGLIRWCVLAPIHQIQPKESKTYSRLHLAILQSLMQTPMTATSGAPTSLNALHLGTIIIALKQKSDQMGASAETDEGMQVSLERFAQSIQLALTSRAMSGNVTQLLCRLDTLPRNTLLQIVIKAHKVTL